MRSTAGPEERVHLSGIPALCSPSYSLSHCARKDGFSGWAKQSQFGNRSDGRAGPQIVGKCSTRLIDATLHAVSDGDLLAIIVQGGLLFEPSVHFRSG